MQHTLQHTITHCNTLRHTATHGNILHHAALPPPAHARWHYNMLQLDAIRYNTLQDTATLCNTLQHTATHCTSLHLTASHCNTLQHTCVWVCVNKYVCTCISIRTCRYVGTCTKWYVWLWIVCMLSGTRHTPAIHHSYASIMPHLSMRHGAHLNESCHTSEWVMAHIWTSPLLCIYHGTYQSESWYIDVHMCVCM